MTHRVPIGCEAQLEDLKPGSEPFDYVDVNHLYAVVHMVQAAPHTSELGVVAIGLAATRDGIRRYKRYPHEAGIVLMTLRQICAVGECVEHLRSLPACQPGLGRIELSTFLNAPEALATGVSISEVVERRAAAQQLRPRTRH